MEVKRNFLRTKAPPSSVNHGSGVVIGWACMAVTGADSLAFIDNIVAIPFQNYSHCPSNRRVVLTHLCSRSRWAPCIHFLKRINLNILPKLVGECKHMHVCVKEKIGGRRCKENRFLNNGVRSHKMVRWFKKLCFLSTKARTPSLPPCFQLPLDNFTTSPITMAVIDLPIISQAIKLSKFVTKTKEYGS